MLSYALAIAIAISSLGLFLTAFLMSDLHRQDDFLWSGVGLFYALVLWYCAQNITGAVLLGQAAATALIVAYSWHNLQLRKAIANPDKATETSKFSLTRSFKRLFKRKQVSVSSTANTASSVKMPKVTETEIAIPDTTSQSTPNPESLQKPTTKVAQSDPSEAINNTQPIAKELVEEEKVNDDSQKTSVETVEVSTPHNTEEKSDNQISQTEELQAEQPSISETKASETSEQQESTSPKNESDKIDESKVKLEESAPITPENPYPKPEGKTTEGKPAKATNNPVAKDLKNAESALDSLETVEVAEILPEDQAANRDQDQSNIIEVTTTEINSTPEIKNLEQNQEDSIDSSNQQQQ
ncbi:MAG: Ycf66 family protein [Cyanobacteria bacterium P01_G01_bin.67]